MDPALDDHEAEFRRHETYPCKGVLFGILIYLKSMTAVTQIVDSVYGDMQSLRCVLGLLLR